MSGDSEHSPVRDRILHTFSTKARRSGIRSVLMGDLASDLRMSIATLYKHFASKEDLVNAMVDAWVDELGAVGALKWAAATDAPSLLEVLMHWPDAWTANLGGVSPAFFEDLKRDHPAAWRRFRGLFEQRRGEAAVHLAPFVRADLHKMAAMRMLGEMVIRAADPRFTERLGISRRESVRTAVALWAGGAMSEPVRLPSDDQ